MAKSVEKFVEKTFIAKSIEYLSLPSHLTEAQNNLINIMLLKCPITGSVDFVEFTMDEIYDFLCITKKDVGWLRKILSKLQEIIIPVKGADGTMIGSPVSDIEYIDDKNIVRLYLSKSAKHHFTNFRDKDTLQVTTPYAKQLVYSSIFQSKNVSLFWNQITIIKGKRDKSVTKTYEEWKELLQLCSNEYEEFAEFKRNVLESVKDQINTKTGIQIDYELIRKHRKVYSIKIFIVSIADYEIAPAFNDVNKSPINTPEEVAKSIELLQENMKLLTEDQVLLLSNFYPAKKIFEFIYQYKMKLNTKQEIWQPDRLLMKSFYDFNKKEKTESREAKLKVKKPAFKIPVIKDFSVNNLAEQMAIKEVLLTEFPLSEPEVRKMIVRFKYDKFFRLVNEIRKRIESGVEMACTPQEEIIRHFEYHEAQKQQLTLKL